MTKGGGRRKKREDFSFLLIRFGWEGKGWEKKKGD